MKAPEKIYIQSFNVSEEDAKFDKSKMFFDDVWTEEPEPGQENIEYTRTDVFMQRAKEAFCKARCNGHPPRSTCTSLGTCKECDNFVKLLKGE